MRYGPEGKPFVPPTCPQEQAGHIPDLEQTEFGLQVHATGLEPPITEVVGVFGPIKNDERPNMVTTGTITAYSDLPWSQKVHRLAGRDGTPTFSMSLSPSEHPAVEQVRVRLCERVANCQGLVDGQCWALGSKALKEVIDQTLNDSNS